MTDPTNPPTLFLMNPIFYEARQQELEARGGRPSEFLPPPGGVKMDISVVPPTGVGYRFDPQVLIQFCEGRLYPGTPTSVEGPPDTGQEITLAGRRAVACRGLDSLYPISEELAEGVVYWVELPSGRTLFINPGTVFATPAEEAVVDAILRSLEFADGA